MFFVSVYYLDDSKTNEPGSDTSETSYRIKDGRSFKNRRLDSFSKYIRPVIMPHKSICRQVKTRLDNKHKTYYGDDYGMLGEIYALYDVNTLKKFNLDIDDDYIERVCYYGKTEILDYLKKTHKLTSCPKDALSSASKMGHINVLNWWVNSGIPLIYDKYAIDEACIYGEIDVIKWWINSGLKLIYTESALSYASSNGYTNILDCLKNSGIPLVYSSHALDCACSVDVLTWWFDSGLKLDYTKHALYYASSEGNVDILKWWFDSGLPLKYPTHEMDTSYYNADDAKDLTLGICVMNMASLRGHIEVLNFWLDISIKKNIPLKYSKLAIDCFYGKNKVNVLTWWKNSGLRLKYSEDAIDEASREGVLEILTWWFSSGLPLKYSEKALIYASRQGQIDVLNLWSDSGLPLVYYEKTILNDLINCESHAPDFASVLDWWFNKSGLHWRDILNEIDLDVIVKGLCKTNVVRDLSNSYGNIPKDPLRDTNVLNFWKNTGLKLKYTSFCYDCASENGRVDVLEWLKNEFGFKSKYTDKTINLASQNKHINVLEWWKNSGLPLKYSDKAFNVATSKGNVAVLEWWVKSGLKLKYSDKALQYARRNKLERVFKWFEKNKDIFGLK